MTQAQQTEELSINQECAEFAASLRIATTTVVVNGGPPPKSLLLAADVFERAAAELSTKDARIQELDAQLAKLTTAYKELSGMFHDQVVAQQAAWIEWQHGKGAEAGMQWIENGLCGPGHIPDEDEPYGKEAQAWFDANQSSPLPFCACGRPSNIATAGHGFCSEAHFEDFRAAQAKQAEAQDVARNGGCGCCANACAENTDGCHFVQENPSASDMQAAQAKQGGA